MTRTVGADLQQVPTASSGRGAYPYAQGDLLTEKPLYNFSAFGGLSFLDGYLADRAAWLAGLTVAAPEPGSFADVLAGAGRDDASAARPTREPATLAELLEDLCLAYRRGEPDAAALPPSRFLDLLQRFEVTKRLWVEVDDRCRPAPEAAPARVDDYARFGLAALTLYGVQAHLSLLNAALKAHDIVTSQPSAALGPEIGAIARRGIGIELDAVKALARRNGVAL